MSKGHTCVQCSKACRKRDILCASCWNGLSKARREAISRAPYSREEKNRKFIINLLSCDLKVVNQIVAEHKIEPKVDEEVEAIYTEINRS